MRPLLEEPAVVRVAAATSAEVTFDLEEPSGCVRVAAVAGPGLAEVELRVLEPEGASHSAHAQGGPFVLLGPEGPVCFDREGTYRVVLQARRGSGPVAVNVWTAR
jgi:hypothetical protein